MNQMVLVGNQQIGIKEYKGQRVVTFKDVDRVHGRPEGTAHRNFKANRKHFIEGKDYFGRNSSEAKKEYDVTAPNGLTLLTESGYLMLVKSLTDDRAWEVQRALVENYFRGKPAPSRPALEAPYEYKAKYWHGVQVVTLLDIEKLAHIPRVTTTTALGRHRRDMKADDCWLLKGSDLKAFRMENPSTVDLNVQALWIISRKGFKRMLTWMQAKPGELTIWRKEEAPAPTPDPHEQSSQTAEKPDVLTQLRQAVTGLTVALDIYESHTARQWKQESVDTLGLIGAHILGLLPAL